MDQLLGLKWFSIDSITGYNKYVIIDSQSDSCHLESLGL